MRRRRAVAVAAVALALAAWARRWWEFSRIPCKAPGTWEMLRLFVRHRGDLGKMFEELTRVHGHGPLKLMFAFGLVRIVVVSSPGMRALERMPKGQWYFMLRVLFGGNLITLNHDAHRQHRRVMSHGFTANSLHALLPALNRHAGRMVSAWRGRRTVDVEDWMTRVAFDIISDQAFGFDADCVGSSKKGLGFAHNCRRIASMVMKHYLHAPGAARAWKLLHHRLFAEVDGVIYSCIRRRRAQRAAAAANGPGRGSGRAHDLLDLMLDAAEQGRGWSDKELRDECFILFLAGHETTAETLSWVLTHVAADGALQARLREELCRVGSVTPETLRLGYPELQKVCKEALRLYPPAFMVTRFCEKAVTIDGCPVPAGYDLMLNLMGLHRHPSAYESPERFDPARWDGKVDSAYFAPFTFGPRICLGRNFFWLEAHAILSAVLTNYELHTERVPDWSTIKISTQLAEPAVVSLRPLAARRELR